MSRPSAESINMTLAALRLLADKTRPMRNRAGHVVADIPAFTGKRRSLVEYISANTSIPTGSVSKHIMWLTNSGFLQAGLPKANVPRWVRLNGEFSHKDR